MTDSLILTKDNTVFKADAKNWEEAVRLTGSILVKLGKVSVDYVEGIVNAVKKLGPYIVIAEGIAIPHARPEEGAIDTGCALVTLKEPVYFEGDESPVKVLIGFSAVDDSSHMNILQMVVEFIEKGMIDELAEISCYEEFIDLNKE